MCMGKNMQITDKYIKKNLILILMPKKERVGRIFELSLPSEEIKKQIQEEARKRKCPASKYILSLFQESIRPANPQADPEIKHLRQENSQLRQVVGEKELLLAQKENELRKLRGAVFQQPTWNADIDSDLLKALRAGPVHDHRLLDILGATDQDSMKAISRQLQILEAGGFIANTARGWSWKK